MNNHALARFGLLLLFISACQKKDDPNPGPPPQPAFELTFHNEFNLLEAQFAVFLSDEDGLVRAFRWLPGTDTAHVSVPDAKAGDRFDCTVVQITVLVVPGSGVRDTTVALTTYTNLSTGADFRLRDMNFLKTTDLRLSLTNISSVDSIIVPDGLTFARPQPGNSFQGQYRVSHTGRFWVRLRIDGEANWRYAAFNNISDPALDVTIDATTLPILSDAPTKITLPFLTAWEYKIDRVVDTAQRQFLAIGNLIRIPGGAVPIFDELDVFEPPNLPYDGYRLRISGADPDPGGYGYSCDRFYAQLPVNMPALNFDVLPTNLSDNRLVAVQCSGDFDLLAFSRSRGGTPGLQWEVLTAPVATGMFVYRLPDVPGPLASLFPSLKKYDFGGSVHVRAESYDQLHTYQEVIGRRIGQDDPLWQPKAGFVARERVF